MAKNISLNEKIFVAGSKGMAGKAICRALFKYGYGKDNGGEILIPTRKRVRFVRYKSCKRVV